MQIFYHPQFLKEFKNLSKETQEVVINTEELFRNNPSHPSLRTHKLHGKLKRFWSLSVTKKYRIVFEYTEDGVVFLMIGCHDIYQ